jgi:hypothetical protein
MLEPHTIYVLDNARKPEMTMFPVGRNSHAPSSTAGEILVFAAAEDFHWVPWMRKLILDSSNPAFAGITVCAPVAPTAYEAAPHELQEAVLRARRVVFPCTEAFEREGAPHREVFSLAWRRQRETQNIRVLPVMVDTYRPRGVLITSMAIHLVGLDAASCRTVFTDELARTIIRPGLSAMPPPHPGAR